MRNLFLLIAIFLLTNLFSQSYFNKKDYEPQFTCAKDFIELDSSYIVLVYQQSEFGGISFLNIDKQGDTIWKRHYLDSAHYFMLEGIIKKEDSFLVFGALRDTGSFYLYQAFFASFDLSTNLNWIKTYDSYDYAVLSACGSTADGGFILSGSKTTNSISDLDFHLLKTDASGDVTWEKSFNNQNYGDISFRNSLVLTADKGYLLGGMTYIPDLDTIAPHNNYMLVKTDSLGNLQWMKILGNTTSSVFGSVVQQNDQSFIVSGTYTYPFTSYYQIRSVLHKLDNDGNIIWEKEVSELQAFDQSLILNPDNSFTLCGRDLDSLGQAMNVFISRFDPLGNLMWKRDYFQDNQEYVSAICTLKAASDGGYVFSGIARDSLSSPHAWIVKTDCFGCDSTLCYYPDSICDVYDCSLYPIDASFTAADYVFNLANEGEDTVTFTNPFGNTTNRVWYFGDGEVAYTDSVVSHAYTEIGTYEVQLIVYYGMCSDTLTQAIEVVDVADLTSPSAEGGGLRRVTIYPNPNKGTFIIESDHNKEVEIKLFNSQGKELYQSQLKKGENEFNLDLAPGVYILESGTQRERIVIH